MNYEKVYNDFYSKYYTKTECIITDVFTKRRSLNKPFQAAYNEVVNYSCTVFCPKYSLSKNRELENLYQLFCKRSSHYTIDAIQGIFENEIKTAFDKVDASDLPPNFNYVKFIKRIALLEQEKEILRLLSVNAQLLKMQYELNAFEDFEIRSYDFILENHPNYKKSLSKLYPENNLNVFEGENGEVLKHRKIELSNTNICENDYLGQASNENANSLFRFLIEYYRPEEKTSVKFVNILHFLKNDANKDLFIFKIKQMDFKKMILERAGIEIKKFAKSERYNEEEKPILNSLELTFRKKIT